MKAEQMIAVGQTDDLSHIKNILPQAFLHQKTNVMRTRSPQRAMAIAIFVIAFTFWNFSRLTGSECIRTIHIVTLLVCGAAIGVFLSSLFLWLRSK